MTLAIIITAICISSITIIISIIFGIRLIIISSSSSSYHYNRANESNQHNQSYC